MSKNYYLKKKIWTEDDFEEMIWHDCRIYAMGFDKDNYLLMLDIDYILEWIMPEGEGKYFKFWVAPATLVFENVHDFNIDIESNLEFQIDNIYREEPKAPKNMDFIKRDIEWKWVIETQEGDMSIRSIGFKLYIRQEPILIESQEIGITNRGGISFNLDVKATK